MKVTCLEESNQVWKWCVIEWQSDKSEKTQTEQDVPNSHEKRGKEQYLREKGREEQRKEGVLLGEFYRDRSQK